MKRKLIALSLLLVSVPQMFAQQWIDVTDKFILNPRYDNNSYAYWQGDGLSGNNPRENAEHWNRTFDTYQDITGLTPGTRYRLSLNAFYRYNTSATDYSVYVSGDYEEVQYARLYATSDVGDFDTGIQLMGSGASSRNLGGGTATVSSGGVFGWNNRLYVPNNMEAASYWFAAGYYKNSVEFKVGDDGKARIGIRKYTYISEDWTCLDDWQLEFYGVVKHVEKVELSTSSISLVPTEEYHLTATVLPSDATYTNVKWSTSDSKIATVDATGKVTAVAAGSCIITATSVDNSSIKAVCAVTVKNNNATPSLLCVNELMASNIDMFMDPSFNYGSWVELYNPSSSPVQLGGVYITDDETNLKKFKFPSTIGVVPAHGYKVLWFDHNGVWNAGEHNQVSFKLDYNGGVIILSDGTNAYITQEYPAAVSRASYARTSDGGNTWGTTAQPTPGASNAASTFCSRQLDAPVVNKDACIFTGSMSFNVTIPSGTQLRYTTDGSTPTETNGEVSTNGRFTVRNTTVYRFRLFADDALPSRVVTRSYILEDHAFTLPVISIVSDNEHFYGSDYGVFVTGSKNGRPGNGMTSKSNWNMDWDRPVNFEYLNNEDGGEYRMLLNQEVDLSRCGGWSRQWTPYSFKLKAAKYYYGENSLNYPFFPGKPYIKNRTLQIRGGGNDNNARIKDAALQQIVLRSGLYVDGQEWVPVLHYINGRFMGVINMREPNNKHYASANYGLDTDELDQFEMSPDSGYVQMEGTKDAFNKLCTLAKNAASAAVYDDIKKLIDIDEYINYMCVEFYLGGTDWPQNNIKGFRDRNDGKFHFVLFDLDGTFATGAPFSTFTGKANYTFDQLHGAYFDGTSIEGKRLTKEIEFVNLFTNLTKNADFKKQFIDRFCVIAGSVFDPDRCKEIITEMASRMQEPMSIYNGYYTSSPWGTANDLISKLNANRISSMVAQMASYFGLSMTGRQQVKLGSNIEGATLMVNDFHVPTGKMAGYLYSPITLKAQAPAGYRFCGWTGSAASGVEKEVFAASAAWSYYDRGSLDNVKWYEADYPTASWKEGSAPLGYGKNQSTAVATGNPTYYFRKSFTIDKEPLDGDVFQLSYTVDDGMIVYVNGVEAGRYNMPSGSVTYNSYSTTYADGNPDQGTMQIPASMFQKGTNVIAVEVHNNSATSSDILWSASLSIITNEYGSDYVSTDSTFVMPSKGNITLTAVFEPINDEALAASDMKPIKINEVSAANSMFVNDAFKKNDWIELYNTTNKDIDVAGLYITDNLAKPQKYQIPTDDVMLNTIVPAGGYLVLWADKLSNTGKDIHLSFKLSDEGGDIAITADPSVAHSSLFPYGFNEAWVDTLSYPQHDKCQTVGLYPDGGSNVYVMEAATIGKSNILTNYSVWFDEPHTSVPDEPVVDPDEPVVDPDEPVVEPDEPVVGPDEPVVDPDEPVVDPDEPVVDPDEPVVDPDEPVVDPDEPVVDPDEPVVDPDEPVVDPDEPVVDPDEPVVEPDEPVVGPDEPVVDPDEPEPLPDAILIANTDEIKIAVVGRTINIKTESNPVVSVTIYDTAGNTGKAEQFVRNEGKFVAISGANLPSAVYVVVVTVSNGKSSKYKITLK